MNTFFYLRMPRAWVCVGLLLSALAVGSVAARAVATGAPAFVPNRCPFPMPQGEVDGVTIQCGTLSVPQDRAKPMGVQIQLAVAVLKSFQRHPLPDSVIHLHGGPGGGSLQFADEGVKVFEKLRERRDVVLFDQRGGGLSKPKLNCYDIVADPAAAGDVTVPAGFDPTRARTLIACADALKAQDIDLTKYNTAENARDVLDLAKALGLKQFNLTGVSYGTLLAQEVMRLNPPGLRSVVLDSSLAPTTKSYEEFYVKGWYVVENAFEDCAKNAGCNKAYPNLRARAIQLLKRLDQSPVRVKQGDLDFTLDGYELMKPLMLSHDVPEVGPYIPRLFAEVEKGKFDTFLAVQAGEIDKLLPASSEDATQLDPKSPAGAFDEAVKGKLEALSDDAAEAARSAYYGALGEIKGRAAIRDVILEHFASDATSLLALLALLAVMSDADLEDLYRANRTVRGSSRELGIFKAFECHDAYPFNDVSKIVSNAKTLPFAIPTEALDDTRTTIAECQFWPTGIADKRSVQPVTSTLPVLVLQGRYDFVTPTPWGKAVAKQFPNATYAEIGLSGHGTMKYSQCARDIAAAFVDMPASKPDLSCVPGTRVEFRAP